MVASNSIELEISEPEPLSVSFASNPGEYVDCNSGQLSVIVEGGTAPYSYYGIMVLQILTYLIYVLVIIRLR